MTTLTVRIHLDGYPKGQLKVNITSEPGPMHEIEAVARQHIYRAIIEATREVSAAVGAAGMSDGTPTTEVFGAVAKTERDLMLRRSGHAEPPHEGGPN